jgi:hypothetical protein
MYSSGVEEKVIADIKPIRLLKGKISGVADDVRKND